MPKAKTPWHDDDFVYFELRSPEFEAFEGINEGGTYLVPEFKPGTYRLALDAIRAATAQDRRQRRSQLISVDTCQMFFVDKSRAAKFRQALDPTEGAWPNYPYFERLRRLVGVGFGFTVVNGDGTYVLDLSKFEWVQPAKKVRPKLAKAEPEDLYEKVARRMRTFVCERCKTEELMEPPNAGPTVLARLAKEQGWRLLPVSGPRKSWFFEAFQVVGPMCAGKSRRKPNQP